MGPQKSQKGVAWHHCSPEATAAKKKPVLTPQSSLPFRGCHQRCLFDFTIRESDGASRPLPKRNPKPKRSEVWVGQSVGNRHNASVRLWVVWGRLHFPLVFRRPLTSTQHATLFCENHKFKPTRVSTRSTLQWASHPWSWSVYHPVLTSGTSSCFPRAVSTMAFVGQRTWAKRLEGDKQVNPENRVKPISNQPHLEQSTNYLNTWNVTFRSSFFSPVTVKLAPFRTPFDFLCFFFFEKNFIFFLKFRNSPLTSQNAKNN